VLSRATFMDHPCSDGESCEESERTHGAI
jgi:hypothetical protein